jgi:N-acetylglutamate synthase-like GNAT family acetyltransferase
MSFYFTFTDLEDISQLRMLVDFMASQDLDYPHYDDWLQKTESQLERREKQAVLAFSDGKLVGNLVHQVCRDNGLGNLREIKNLRIHPEVRERYFANFMLKQLYVECENKYEGLILDVRANQKETYNFLVYCGFIPVMNISLYEKNMDEIVMFKPFREKAELGIPKVKKIIQARSF